ncbi:MAG: transcription elongation factor Spt5, partial [Nitrososphaeraceae archaeon]
MEGSTTGNEDKFDDLDTVFAEKSEIKSDTTSDISENIDAVQADASELDTNMEKSEGIETSAENSQIQPDSQESDSKFFAIRTTGGQEHIVVNLAQNRINSKRIPVRSILLLDSFKGYIIIEAQNSNIAYDALIGVRHVKGQIRGELPYKDIENYLVKRPVVSELNIDDTVEVIAGPFKSMKAKIT